MAVLVSLGGAHAAEFRGRQALEDTRHLVALGPRPSGSPAIRKAQQWILSQLKGLRCEVLQNDFEARTPVGPLAMKNIVARFPGSSGRAIAVSGHYDTKYMPGTVFVGANDGGASAGFLIELARALNGRPRRDDVYLVWFDGEEAIVQWSERDSLYGSRHLAQRWAADGVLARLKALINVDMIGDRNLQLIEEQQSTPWLRKLVRDTGQKLGYGRYFSGLGGVIEDDHIPFLRAGVAAVDLIHNYGGAGSYWHTPEDTMDKLGENAFQAVGDIVLRVIAQLEERR
jgi:Zn-dependent M28 family amino/carboxypeptidase